jgi:hypothetical protein
METIDQTEMSQTKVPGKNITCKIPKAKTTHSDYVLFTAFQQQLYVHEQAAIPRYMQLHHMSSRIIVGNCTT